MLMSVWPEISGYLAASLLLVTFFMREMVPLRAVAIAASMAWLVFGLSSHIFPIVALHSVLLPLNSFRLIQALRGRTAASRAPGPARPSANPTAVAPAPQTRAAKDGTVLGAPAILPPARAV